jgi:hypothetical protein
MIGRKNKVESTDVAPGITPKLNFRQLLTAFQGGVVRVRVPETRASIYDYYLGMAALTEVPWGTSGAKLAENIVLVRTYRPDPFRFAFRYADEWHEYALVRPDDPGVLELDAAGRITHHPEDPAVAAKRAAREEAEQAQRVRTSGGELAI